MSRTPLLCSCAACMARTHRQKLGEVITDDQGSRVVILKTKHSAEHSVVYWLDRDTSGGHDSATDN